MAQTSPPPAASARRANRPATRTSDSAGDDMRAARTVERGARVLEMADDGAPAAALDVADRRLDLWSHAAAAEMALALVALELAQLDALERALSGLAEIHRDPLDRGEDEEIGQAELAR